MQCKLFKVNARDQYVSFYKKLSDDDHVYVAHAKKMLRDIFKDLDEHEFIIEEKTVEYAI